jgi:hypothetical protein
LSFCSVVQRENETKKKKRWRRLVWFVESLSLTLSAML